MYTPPLTQSFVSILCTNLRGNPIQCPSQIDKFLLCWKSSSCPSFCGRFCLVFYRILSLLTSDVCSFFLAWNFTLCYPDGCQWLLFKCQKKKKKKKKKNLFYFRDWHILIKLKSFAIFFGAFRIAVRPLLILPGLKDRITRTSLTWLFQNPRPLCSKTRIWKIYLSHGHWDCFVHYLRHNSKSKVWNNFKLANVKKEFSTGLTIDQPPFGIGAGHFTRQIDIHNLFRLLVYHIVGLLVNNTNIDFPSVVFQLRGPVRFHMLL